jgi:hypothetical protein
VPALQGWPDHDGFTLIQVKAVHRCSLRQVWGGCGMRRGDGRKGEFGGGNACCRVTQGSPEAFRGTVFQAVGTGGAAARDHIGGTRVVHFVAPVVRIGDEVKGRQHCSRSVR